MLFEFPTFAGSVKLECLHSNLAYTFYANKITAAKRYLLNAAVIFLIYGKSYFF